jgi:hypothetical protein
MCPVSVAHDAAERAAIEGREMPAHSLTGCVCELPATLVQNGERARALLRGRGP